MKMSIENGRVSMKTKSGNYEVVMYEDDFGDIAVAIKPEIGLTTMVIAMTHSQHIAICPPKELEFNHGEYGVTILKAKED